MNGTTLTELGWNLTDYTTMDEPEEPDRPETEMHLCADNRASVFEEGQAWVLSDTTMQVEP